MTDNSTDIINRLKRIRKIMSEEVQLEHQIALMQTKPKSFQNRNHHYLTPTPQPQIIQSKPVKKPKNEITNRPRKNGISNHHELQQDKMTTKMQPPNPKQSINSKPVQSKKTRRSRSSAGPGSHQTRPNQLPSEAVQAHKNELNKKYQFLDDDSNESFEEQDRLDKHFFNQWLRQRVQNARQEMNESLNHRVQAQSKQQKKSDPLIKKGAKPRSSSAKKQKDKLHNQYDNNEFINETNQKTQGRNTKRKKTPKSPPYAEPEPRKIKKKANNPKLIKKQIEDLLQPKNDRYQIPQPIKPIESQPPTNHTNKKPTQPVKENKKTLPYELKENNHDDFESDEIDIYLEKLRQKRQIEEEKKQNTNQHIYTYQPKEDPGLLDDQLELTNRISAKQQKDTNQLSDDDSSESLSNIQAITQNQKSGNDSSDILNLSFNEHSQEINSFDVKELGPSNDKNHAQNIIDAIKLNKDIHLVPPESLIPNNIINAINSESEPDVLSSPVDTSNKDEKPTESESDKPKFDFSDDTNKVEIGQPQKNNLKDGKSNSDVLFSSDEVVAPLTGNKAEAIVNDEFSSDNINMLSKKPITNKVSQKDTFNIDQFIRDEYEENNKDNNSSDEDSFTFEANNDVNIDNSQKSAENKSQKSNESNDELNEKEEIKNDPEDHISDNSLQFEDNAAQEQTNGKEDVTHHSDNNLSDNSLSFEDNENSKQTKEEKQEKDDFDSDTQDQPGFPNQVDFEIKVDDLSSGNLETKEQLEFKLLQPQTLEQVLGFESDHSESKDNETETIDNNDDNNNKEQSQEKVDDNEFESDIPIDVNSEGDERSNEIAHQSNSSDAIALLLESSSNDDVPKGQPTQEKIENDAHQEFSQDEMIDISDSDNADSTKINDTVNGKETRDDNIDIEIENNDTIDQNDFEDDFHKPSSDQYEVNSNTNQDINNQSQSDDFIDIDDSQNNIKSPTSTFEEKPLSTNDSSHSDGAASQKDDTDINIDDISHSDGAPDQKDDTDINIDDISHSDGAPDQKDDTDINIDDISHSDGATSQKDDTDINIDDISHSDGAADQNDQSDISDINIDDFSRSDGVANQNGNIHENSVEAANLSQPDNNDNHLDSSDIEDIVVSDENKLDDNNETQQNETKNDATDDFIDDDENESKFPTPVDFVIDVNELSSDNIETKPELKYTLLPSQTLNEALGFEIEEPNEVQNDETNNDGDNNSEVSDHKGHDDSLDDIDIDVYSSDNHNQDADDLNNDFIDVASDNEKNAQKENNEDDFNIEIENGESDDEPPTNTNQTKPPIDDSKIGINAIAEDFDIGSDDLQIDVDDVDDNIGIGGKEGDTQPQHQEDDFIEVAFSDDDEFVVDVNSD